MNIKADVGVCREINEGTDKLVAIPKNPGEFKNTEPALIMSAKDFKKKQGNK